MDDKELLALAHQAREHAYAPYSNFLVGAALLADSGKEYLGCNVENASYGAGNCAERTAFFKAVSEGERSFSKIAIVGGLLGSKADGPCYPCGICRQVMSEFCDLDSFQVLFEGGNGTVKKVSLRELMPLAFGK